MSNLPVLFSRRGLHLSVLLLAALFASALHAATTITIRPDSSSSLNGDAFVSSANATNNYGGAGALAVTASLAKGAFDSLIRMDLAAAKTAFDADFGAGQWTITSVLIELTSGSPNNAIFNSPNTAGAINVLWFGNDAWVEGTGTPMAISTTGVTWNNIGSFTTGAESMGGFAYNTSGTQQYTLNPSAGFINDVNLGNQTSLWLTPGDSTVSALFNARSFGTASSRPALIITAAATAVPEPGRLMLLLVGVNTCLWRRRRLPSSLL